MPSGIFSNDRLRKVADNTADPSIGISSAIDGGHNTADEAIYRAGQAGVVGSNLFDMYSTKRNLDTGRAREANPVSGSGSVARMAMVKAPIAGLTLYGMHKIAKEHPRLAGMVGAIGSVAPLLAGIHNTNLYKKLQNP